MPPQPVRRKTVIVGDGACGKTSLLCVFALGEFPQEYQPTIFENYVAEIRLDGKPVLLALWDTAGQEEYERLRPLSYSHAHVILIAFSIDTPDSLENVRYKWNEEVRQICGRQIPVILVGCKRDLRDDAEAKAKAAVVADSLQSNGAGAPPDLDWQKNFVSKRQGVEMANSIGARVYLETSALKNDGVDAVFEAATRAAMLVRDSEASTGGGGRVRDADGGMGGLSAGGTGGEKHRTGGDPRGGRRKGHDDVGGCRCVIL
ncbi:ras-domain-containing protein [Tilletiaria anomala UBC 951]|uniref:Ras-domain-containing protein n=1 Tax=Tilletiaria anomala (strain ATCC 24038 / CBS 436.72 / UBC 951) TaxID=1037660 RepID=A0A066VPY1_TILAU|nr:ras-domain-containing protein [Tilletiaria anomala UBC 951]KDN43541.1 ras-domain-containing protein [Tilletiaria anomala UBC 951]